MSFKKYLSEINLNRIYKHLYDPNEYVVIFTTWRGNRSTKENENSLRDAAAQLKMAGFGYVYVEGHWIENKGTDQERMVSEMSIFAIAPRKRGKELVRLCKKIADKNEQEAIFVKEGNGKENNFYLLLKDGGVQKLRGKFTTQIDDIYTKLLRKNKAFVIEDFKAFTLKSFWGIYAVKMHEERRRKLS